MMAGQGTVNVYIDMKNLNENNKTISFAFSNVGKDQKLHFNIQNLDAGTSTALDNNWAITNEGNGKLVTTWKAKDSDPQTLNLTIPLEANPKVVKDKSVVKVGLTITTDNQTVNYPLLTARVKPYEDKIRQDEITKYDNFRPYFDKYLVANVDRNSIKFEQDGTFYIPVNGKDDTSYTSHAYFIKIDTLLPKNMTKPNKGDFLYSQSFKGDGMTIDNSYMHFTNQITGNSTSQPTNPQPTKPQPTTPVSPTTPEPVIPITPVPEPVQPTDNSTTPTPEENIRPHKQKNHDEDEISEKVTNNKKAVNKEENSNSNVRPLATKEEKQAVRVHQAVAKSEEKNQLPATNGKNNKLGLIGLVLAALSLGTIIIDKKEKE